jgi:hypothetical protein
MHKIVYCIALIAEFMGIILILTLLYWYIYPYKVIEFKDIDLVKKVYTVGTPLEMNIIYCKYIDLPAKTARQFINGMISTLSDQSNSNSPVGCTTKLAMDIIVPKELKPDIYIYKQTMSYHVNPIRDIVVVFQTEPFNVVEATPSAK